jgi:hypothetical protein
MRKAMLELKNITHDEELAQWMELLPTSHTVGRCMRSDVGARQLRK